MSQLVFIVLDDRAGTNEPKKVYVFDNHPDALKCRMALGLDHFHLWGTTINCYNR